VADGKVGEGGHRLAVIRGGCGKTSGGTERALVSVKLTTASHGGKTQGCSISTKKKEKKRGGQGISDLSRVACQGPRWAKIGVEGPRLEAVGAGEDHGKGKGS